ncbi:50S ribosomal protein L29 [Candidatus Gracilibacteria bacterium]|nr:MAG: 50S ribosomal protein L29 [Candidatus Gracilibacteria bacterium]
MAKKTKSSNFKPLDILRGMSRDELMTELETTRKELFILRMKKTLGELKQTHHIKLHKKYIAQLSTFLSSAL